MSPNLVYVHGLATAMAPNPLNSYSFGGDTFAHATMLTWTQGQILDLSSLGALKSIPGLVFVDLCSVFRAGAVGHVLGTNLAENRPKTKKN